MRQPGVVGHQATTPPIRRLRAAIPVTDPIRTLLDVAGTGAATGSLIDRALTHHLVTLDRLEEATRRTSVTPRAGKRLLRAGLEERGYVGSPHPSVLESRMARLLVSAQRRHGLPHPKPELTWQGGRYRLDYAWPSVLLAVEVDGYVWHAGAADLDRDHARRSDLAADRWTILAFTWRQVVGDPDRVVTTIVTTYRGLRTRLSQC